mmetsp:Transcript_16990/g.25215  ORF Transcript_16990/g.25215 Transcript_16990/m.25215 type:complete len:377 (-) Transcript_16990:130-1260(-)|eukprot:CAMPEP_0194031300 /NCGR_PEP_ID=MMETSP0009_2-20130614/4506_1 /TAXON_ID=210454 /ORGANISM="Grammatophora oceanica, Strain CCMP 410" /LENGTH=376 /DNA_ID=CAMNT_0038671425 /DNA_START=54 /DNA_END=1184 /DNA_ORIENTATION=-
MEEPQEENDQYQDEIQMEEGGLTTTAAADGGGGDDDGTVVYQWAQSEIRLAQSLSVAGRQKGRTLVDNEVDLVSYLNNKETWYAAGSRFMLFMGASWGVAGIFVLLVASGEEAKEEGLTLWEHMKIQGSVSSLYQAGDSGANAPTQLFQAFLTAASVLIMMSNFGFYVLPRWENHVSLSMAEGNLGEITHLSLKYFCICRANYKRIEATSNWVTSEEGVFKMAYNMLAGVVVLLVAAVPLPPAGNRSEIQVMVHMLVALLAFGVMGICELYQIIRGERIFKRRSGVIQILRLCMILLAVAGMGVYIFCRSADEGTTKRGMAALWETIGFLAMFVDLMLLCLIPIKVEQSVFALSGDKWLKEHGRRESVMIDILKHE